MKPSFFESDVCKSRGHCNLCRKVPSFRRQLFKAGVVDEVDFACPYGVEAGSDLKYPLLRNLVKNFSESVIPWVKRGFKVADKAKFDHRLATCRSCFLWDEQGYAGWGRCHHGKCQCTLVKLWLENATCPDGYWENGVPEKMKRKNSL